MKTAYLSLTISVMARKLAVLGTVLTTLLGANVNATPIPAGMTDQDVNTLVALEATQNTLTFLAMSLNQSVPTQSLGSWTGTIDAAGWSLGFSGSLNNIPLSITQSGQLDMVNGLATWTDAGLMGSDNITGSGQVVFDPSWTQTILKGLSIGTIGGIQALLSIPAGGANVVINAFASGIEIAIVGKIIDDSFEVKSTQTKNTQTKTAILNSLGNSGANPVIFFSIAQVGFQDLATGEVSFNAAVIPEPDTLLLFVTAFLGLICLGKSYRGGMNRPASRGASGSQGEGRQAIGASGLRSAS